MKVAHAVHRIREKFIGAGCSELSVGAVKKQVAKIVGVGTDDPRCPKLDSEAEDR